MAEFRGPEGFDAPRYRERGLFLTLVREEKPEVLGELWDLWEAHRPELPPDDALHAWARKHNLDAPWLLEVARETIAPWGGLTERPDPILWSRVYHRVPRDVFEPATTGEEIFRRYEAGRVEPFPEMPGFRFRFRPVNLYSDDTSADYREQATTAFRNALEAYLADAQRRAAARGTPYRPKQAGRRTAGEEEHFRRFVRFQVCGETYRAIGERDEIVKSAQYESYRDIADRLGLTMRTLL